MVPSFSRTPVAPLPNIPVNAGLKCNYRDCFALFLDPEDSYTHAVAKHGGSEDTSPCNIYERLTQPGLVRLYRVLDESDEDEPGRAASPKREPPLTKSMLLSSPVPLHAGQHHPASYTLVPVSSLTEDSLVLTALSSPSLSVISSPSLSVLSSPSPRSRYSSTNRSTLSPRSSPLYTSQYLESRPVHQKLSRRGSTMVSETSSSQLLSPRHMCTPPLPRHGSMVRKPNSSQSSPFSTHDPVCTWDGYGHILSALKEIRNGCCLCWMQGTICSTHKTFHCPQKSLSSEDWKFFKKNIPFPRTMEVCFYCFYPVNPDPSFHNKTAQRGTSNACIYPDVLKEMVYFIYHDDRLRSRVFGQLGISVPSDINEYKAEIVKRHTDSVMGIYKIIDAYLDLRSDPDSG